MAIILDISHHQISSKIDWAKAAKEVAFVIIRVQYGSKLIDREYKNHVANCKKYGIPFGHYAYGMFVSVEDAKVEARDFLNRIDKEAKFLALDTEENTIKSCSTKNVAAASQAFIDVCKVAGWKTGFYVSHHLYKQHGLDKVKADFLWLPRYGPDNGQPTTKPAYPCCLWQYSQNCKVGWYPNDLDLNLLHGDKTLEWFTGKLEEKVVEAPKTEVKSETVKKPTKKPKRAAKHGKYKVVSGDTLTAIANDFGVSVNDLVKWNNIKNKNVIRSGQDLIVEKPKSTKKYHKVVSGDTVSELALKYGSPMRKIKDWNNLDNNFTIYIGKSLRVK